MSAFWDFLSDPGNREILTWIGGGLVVLAGGVWTVVKFFQGRDKGKSPGISRPTIRAESGGIASGRDVHIQTSHGLSGGRLVALIAVVVGAVLLAAGMFGDRVISMQGVAVGGDVNNSPITVNGGWGGGSGER